MLKLLKRLISLLEGLALLLLMGAIIYNLGYQSGSSDGYASGYFNGVGGIYAEAPSENLRRTIKDDVVFAVKAGVSHIKDRIQTKKSYKELEGGFQQYEYIIAEQSVSDEITWRVQQSLDKIPTVLLYRFVDDGWSVVVSKNGFNTEYDSAHVYQTTGLIEYCQKKIFVDGDSYGIDETVAHEFGHYFDYVFDRPSESEEWKACYKEEWERFYIIKRNFHSIGTESECFADIFAWYLWHHEELRDACPLSYALMDNLVREFQAAHSS